MGITRAETSPDPFAHLDARIVSSNRAAATNTGSARTANAPSEIPRTVVRSGYTHQIDARERTRRVSGMLTVAQTPVRSRTSQRQAGGTERRASDDGGHYIAARFNGPTEAFNHFAQDERDRWTELVFVLRDGKFEVAYFYPDEIDPEEDVIERRERALRRISEVSQSSIRRHY